MVRALTGRTEEEARAALAEAGGRTKLAVLLLNGLDADEAARRLAQFDGHLGKALVTLPT
jgi:N-acetylmuramic acid 6-phosphate (MurNAc-6-P) etherase